MSINTLNPRTHTVVLYQGDDLAVLDRLAGEVNDLRDKVDREARKAKGAPPRLLGEADPVTDASAACDAKEAEHDAALADAKPRAVTIVLRALGRKTFRQLVDAHPPREGNTDDKAAGVNEDTFVEALVPLSIASPAFASDAERDEFLDSLTYAQFRALYLWAYALNTTEGASPKALTASGHSPLEPETPL